MRKHTCHLDLRQRSLYVTIGQKNWVPEVARQPQEEVARQPRDVAQLPRGEVSRQAKLFQPTQPIPEPICYRSGQPVDKHEVFVDKGEVFFLVQRSRRNLFRGLERSMRNLLTKNSILQKDQGNLISRQA